MDCPFCSAESSFVRASGVARALFDAYPVSPGHMLIVPVRHEPDALALTPEELRDMIGLIPTVRRIIEDERVPDGYNIGFNIGAAGGQTVEHAHLHVIPRYNDDVPDARGGIRWVIPPKADYWSEGDDA